MKIKHLILSYLTALILFLLIDLLWLGLIAKEIYLDYLGALMASSTNWYAAILFYFIYIAGILYFSVYPALKVKNQRKALLNGILLGFLCYSTFELTALALLKNWPIGIVWIDILWGSFLTGIVALFTYKASINFN